MCGITGFIEFNSDTTTSDVYLSKMVEIMHRRGPDASNFKLYDGFMNMNKKHYLCTHTWIGEKERLESLASS